MRKRRELASVWDRRERDRERKIERKRERA